MAHLYISIYKLAAECISTGIGCPVLANDDVIIPYLTKYGIKKEDVENYGVAACWEPLVPGKSFDQNNVGCINFIMPLSELLTEGHFDQYVTFNQFFNSYLIKLRSYIQEKINQSNSFKVNEDICFSTFIPSCAKKHQDISEGGAIYNDFGLLTVGMGNLVNSLLNVKKYVYEEGILTLDFLSKVVQENYQGYDDIRHKLQSNPVKFGMQEPDAISLTNQIISVVNECIDGKTNSLGGKFRFGLSSPSYIMDGSRTPASLDGREANQALSTHISCEDGIPFTELVLFVSQLDYKVNGINGNVVDFIVSPNLIRNNLDKFVIFLKQSIKLGFFEMQMNVVSSETLISAKAHPENFPNLIVRVWGFSAYFNDLPDTYKDVLIERALKAEKCS